MTEGRRGSVLSPGFPFPLLATKLCHPDLGFASPRRGLLPMMRGAWWGW